MPLSQITVARPESGLESLENDAAIDRLLLAQAQSLAACRKLQPELSDIIKRAANRLRNDAGRIIFVGSGASGRLVLNTSLELHECFGWPRERLSVLMAEGARGATDSVPGAGHEQGEAARRMNNLQVTQHDVVVGVADSDTPFTRAALSIALSRSALVVALAPVDAVELLALSNAPLAMPVMADVLHGASRPAQDLAARSLLNLWSNLLMVRLNRTYKNLMVDMRAESQPLAATRIDMLRRIHPHLSEAHCVAHLGRANGWVKLAALTAVGASDDTARALLKRFDGSHSLYLIRRTEGCRVSALPK